MSFPTSINLDNCEQDSSNKYICSTSAPNSNYENAKDDAQSAFDNAVKAQQRTIGIGVGVGVGLFLLFAGLAIWAFRRHSKKRTRQINEQAQTQASVLQPKMSQTNPPQSWIGQRDEVDGLAYRAEVEAQDKPHQYQPYQAQEMNANPYGSQFQGGPILEAQGTHDAQEMPLSYKHHPPQEMPGGTQDRGVDRR
ncbi:unnamed protein product [Alternaria alternata]